MPVLEQDITYETLKKVADALADLLSPFCEVAIHDFTDIEHSIIHISGNITGRSIGDAAADSLLAQIREDNDQVDQLTNCLTNLPDGRLMKSRTVFLRDRAGNVSGAFCVNLDIGDLVAIQNYIGALIAADNESDIAEMLSDDINETLQTMISETLSDLGNGAPIMTRNGKIELIRRLDQKGVFQVKKVVTMLANQLGISRATVYNYLREARQK